MPTTTPHILALAELLALHLPLPPGRERVDRDRFSALLHHRPDPYRNLVLRLRIAPGELETTVAEVRALYRARGTTESTWQVGPSSTPPDLAAQLVQRRWEEAVARGTPVLVVQAGGMSRPILERLGFVEVTRVKMLRDRFG